MKQKRRIDDHETPLALPPEVGTFTVAAAVRRMQLPDRLLAFSEELNRAHTVPAVCAALVEHIGSIPGGYTGLVYLYEPSGPHGAGLYRAHHAMIPADLGDAPLPADARLLGPGTIGVGEIEAAGAEGPLSGLAPVARHLGATTLAWVPLAGRGLLMLVERRIERVLGADDWDLFRALARQAEVALERVSLFERVHALSLTDPLTGLGNRRRLDVVMKHAFAAARRGQPLSVVMIDLDHFKTYNDVHGHIRGDEVLKSFGACLQEQVRGSDLVVRFGGDEFLFVLAGATAAMAHATIDRLRDTLSVPVHFTAGVAEYDATVNSPDELIERADRALYEGRSDRKPAARTETARIGFGRSTPQNLPAAPE